MFRFASVGQPNERGHTMRHGRYRAGLLIAGSVITQATILPVAAVAQRATADRPDDVSGHQIHVMYVLPRDGIDEGLDVNGTIATSVAAFQTWLAEQTGGRRLRLDTHQGALDITFLRLSRSEAQLAASGPQLRDQIEAELLLAGINHPNKLYAVYYGGGTDFACGGGAYPPDLPGSVAALYLRGTPPGAPPCATNRFASSDRSPGYLEFSMLHEIFHTMGVVGSCAPHHTLRGHVSEDPRDLMYAGPDNWQPSILDIGRDDYFNHNRRGCLDLARSAFLDPSGPEATPPPSWPTVSLRARACGLEATTRSRESRTPISIRFFNLTSQVVQLHFLDFNGRRQPFGALQPSDSRFQPTFITHTWVMTDSRGQCLALFSAEVEEEQLGYRTFEAVLGSAVTAPPTDRTIITSPPVGSRHSRGAAVTFAWTAVPGVAQYGFEHTGPGRQFANPNGTAPDPVNGFGGAGGGFVVAGTSFTTTVPPSIPPGTYEIRVTGLSPAGQVVGVFSDAVTVVVD